MIIEFGEQGFLFIIAEIKDNRENKALKFKTRLKQDSPESKNSGVTDLLVLYQPNFQANWRLIILKLVISRKERKMGM